MSGYTPSDKAKRAVASFLDAADVEAVPDTHLFAEDGMAPGYQRALAVLRACAIEGSKTMTQTPPPEPPPIVPARAQPDPATIKPYHFPTLEESVSTSPGVPPYQAPEAEPAPAPPSAPVEASAEPVPSPSPQKDSAPAVPVAAPAPPSLLTVKRSGRIKNGRAGEPYADTLKIDGAIDLKLVNAGRTGLTFDDVRCAFEGQPEEAGDFEIMMKGRIDGRPAEIIVHLSVNPDPKKLWESFARDPTAKFWKPDEAFQALASDQLRMLAASKRGRSHARDGGFREDDFALAVHGQWHLAAVADGAGSATFSRRGSRLAVETATNRLPALIDQHLGDDLEPLLARRSEGDAESEIGRRLYQTLITAAFAAAEALTVEAEQLGESVSKLSTTIILVIARKFAAGWFVAAFSIGDGGAALLDLEAATVQPLTAPDSGEYAGQTRFLAKAEFAEGQDVTKRLRYVFAERFTAIALMSDGITDPKLPTDKAFADFETWRGLWMDDLTKEVNFAGQDAAIEEQFLAWLDFWSPGNHDDRTLAVLLPAER